MKGFVPVQRKDKIYRYINIAWMKKNKNQSMLIHAFHKTFKDMENVELVLIGDGPERKNLELQIKELNLEDRVILKGNINREDIPHELQQADAFVLSSQIETFGVVLIEAMSCGLPVIATRCGGPESIISNDTLGILCRINIDSLSKALLHVYHSDYDPQLIRQHVMDNFSEKAVISKLSTIYQELMGEKQSDGA
ncbi:MAG: glycosyltransferase [Spirochaetaceae bacterium]|nr:glycosyltransferase [Spirochaetaceae bacterium]